MRIDHVAIASADIPATARWYVEQFGATILHQDDTWAFLKIGGSKLAIVTPGQHPPHLAFALTDPELEEQAVRLGKTIAPHRDGTRSIYITDPAGNAVELISYPPGNAYKYRGCHSTCLRLAEDVDSLQSTH